MGGVIGSAQSGAIDIMNNVKATIPGAKFGVVDYKDYYPGTGSAGDYPYKLGQALSTDGSAVSTAINGLSAGGGGDEPEAAGAAFVPSFDAGNPWGWSGGTVAKYIVLFTDADAHDPDPGSGLSMATILSDMNTAGVTLLGVIDNHQGMLPYWQANATMTGTKATAIAYIQSTFVADVTSLILGAAARSLTRTVSDPAYASWVSSTPPSYSVPGAGGDFTFNMTITVPGSATGVNSFNVNYYLDGVLYDTQAVQVTASCMNLQVLDGTTDIPDGTGSVDFGASQPGTNITKTFTVTNTGTDPVTLTAPITIPAGYTLTASFGSTSLAPAASTTFQVTLSAKVVGTYTGQVSFANNVAAKNPFNFAITGIMGPAVAGSTAAHDGWILESAKGSGKGGTMDNTETIIRLGDNAAGQQYRSILSFKARNIPTNATITGAVLKIRLKNIMGSDPRLTFGDLLVDIVNPYFGAFNLELTDFVATPDRSAVAKVGTTQFGTYYYATIAPGALQYISKTGYTQLRLHFATPTDNDGVADIATYYSGDWIPAHDYIPVLEITYTVP